MQDLSAGAHEPAPSAVCAWAWRARGRCAGCLTSNEGRGKIEGLQGQREGAKGTSLLGKKMATIWAQIATGNEVAKTNFKTVMHATVLAPKPSFIIILVLGTVQGTCNYQQCPIICTVPGTCNLALLLLQHITVPGTYIS